MLRLTNIIVLVAAVIGTPLLTECLCKPKSHKRAKKTSQPRTWSANDIPAEAGYEKFAQANFRKFYQPGDLVRVFTPSKSTHWGFEILRLKSDSTFTCLNSVASTPNFGDYTDGVGKLQQCSGMYTRSGNRLSFEVSSFDGILRPSGIVLPNGDVTTGLRAMGVFEPVTYKKRP